MKILEEMKMREETYRIRIANEQDAEQIQNIYAPYVEHTAITFEYDVPSLEEMKGRIQRTLEKYPYIVAESREEGDGGEILGYAYAGPFVGRAAYNWAAELSIYVKEGNRKRGIGRKLYETMEMLCRAQNILNLNACIAYPEKEGEHLTKNSVEFHTHMGYTMVGKFHKCGYKFDTWYHMVWMEKMLGPHQTPPAPVIWFPQLLTHIATDI